MTNMIYQSTPYNTYIYYWSPQMTYQFLSRQRPKYYSITNISSKYKFAHTTPTTNESCPFAYVKEKSQKKNTSHLRNNRVGQIFTSSGASARHFRESVRDATIVSLEMIKISGCKQRTRERRVIYRRRGDRVGIFS